MAYDARLCAAELRILAGDLNKLMAPGTSKLHQQGLNWRIRSALGTLAWLCRRFAAQKGLAADHLQATIGRLRKAFADSDYQLSNKRLSELLDTVPLPIDGLRAADANNASRQTGEKIYQRYCAACHQNPNLETPTPAFSLFELAAKLPEVEFIARMLGGVRGTHQIGLRNPLSDADIAGMYAYFLDYSR